VEVEYLDELADVVRVAGPAANAFIASRCSGEAANTRRPGWSNTLDAAGSPPGAT
jgi:hypothetical protein